jgi:hypothetical protein
MKKRILLTTLTLALLLLAFSLPAMGTTRSPDYYITLPGDAPAAGGAAPYGQYLVTHNSVGITTTELFGTVARTAGYDINKVLICIDDGATDAQVNLYGRITSSGDLYEITPNLATITAGTGTWTAFTNTAPWMSLGITSTEALTETDVTCGIYVQTP